MAQGKFDAWNSKAIRWWPTNPRDNCELHWRSERYEEEYFFPAKYSSLTKFLWVTVYLARFIYNWRHSKSERCIGTSLVEEIEQARKVWISSTAAESFPQNVAALKWKQHVSSKSKSVSLSPFLDGRGIVRAGGQIEGADIPFCRRHPIVLSPDHEFFRFIVMKCHERLKHERVDHVRNELGQQCWILRYRTTVAPREIV